MGSKSPTPETGATGSVATNDQQFDATEHCQPSSEKVAKRAEWEAFEFRVLGEDDDGDAGNVRVVNASHEEPSEHRYEVVCDERGVPKWCLKVGDDGYEDCPARKYHCDHDAEPIELCKHAWAVATQPSIVQAVRAIKGGDQ